MMTIGARSKAEANLPGIGIDSGTAVGVGIAAAMGVPLSNVLRLNERKTSVAGIRHALAGLGQICRRASARSAPCSTRLAALATSARTLTGLCDSRFAHQMNLAALPGGPLKVLGHRPRQPTILVGDDEHHAFEATTLQPAEGLVPGHESLAVADLHPEYLPAPIAPGTRDDQRGSARPHGS